MLRFGLLVDREGGDLECEGRGLLPDGVNISVIYFWCQCSFAMRECVNAASVTKRKITACLVYQTC